MKKIDKLLQKINEIRERESKEFLEAVSLLPPVLAVEFSSNRKYANSLARLRERNGKKIVEQFSGNLFDGDTAKVYADCVAEFGEPEKIDIEGDNE